MGLYTGRGKEGGGGCGNVKWKDKYENKKMVIDKNKTRVYQRAGAIHGRFDTLACAGGLKCRILRYFYIDVRQGIQITRNKGRFLCV